MRMVPDGVSTRCIDPVTSCAAPRNRTVIMTVAPPRDRWAARARATSDRLRARAAHRSRGGATVMITVRFLGAAQEVTGSMHLVETPSGTILIDCGFFQGRRD